MTAEQSEITYLSGRKKYTRPQGLVFTEEYGTSDNGAFVPTGYEFNSEVADNIETFLILSDHNRSPIDISTSRLETRQRMINGRMRSYHIDDKVSIRVSWNDLPSRAFTFSPEFVTGVGLPTLNDTRTQYTVDGGAGGSELKRWYEDHVGPFYVLLSYDNYASLSDNLDILNKASRLQEYTQVLEMYISDFSVTVSKRGTTNHDLWSVSISLEEA